MQRHKMNHSFGQQGGQQGGHEHGADCQCPKPEDGFFEQDGILFGQNAGKDAASAAEQDETAPAAEQAAAVESIIEERCKAELNDLRLRNAAEMDNFKKRLAREHEEQMRYAAEKVLGDLLPTLDNLDLALRYGSKSEACKDMLQGVAMTHKLLLEAVENHGLKPMG